MKQLIFTLGIVLLLGSAAFAQKGPRGPMKEAMQKLHLTADQQKSMKDIHMKTAKQMIDVRAELQKKRIDVQAAMGGDNPDRKALENLWTDIAKLEVNRKVIMFDTHQQMMKLLTPEQQKIWKEHRGAMMQGARGPFRDGQRGREVIREKRIIRRGNDIPGPPELNKKEEEED
jgi:Spy/CpxP family protein refolding chaperone